MPIPLISICIITLGRESIYRTLESVLSQKVDVEFEIVIVLQGTLDEERIKKLNIKNIPLKIHNYPHNLGFGYYRNQCIEHAHGEILAWIDDDEWTMDDQWLETLTRPIREGKYEVVSSGCYIPLRQGYMTDCVSLLGWPGGGALGFEKIWVVKSDQTTTHLCSGNFAIKKSLVQSLGFSEQAHHGGEDNALAQNLLLQNIPIYYQKSATVYHTARSFKSAISWWKGRAKSMKQGTKNDAYEESPLKKKIRFIKNLFVFDKYLIGKLICMVYLLSLITQKNRIRKTFN